MVEEKKNQTKVIASVEKAIRVLMIVARSQSGMSVTEISRELGGGISATYHLLNTLRQSDMLQQDAQSKKYTIGVGVFRLHALAQRQNTLAGAAQPELDALCRETGETSNLAVLEDKETIYVAQTESSSMVKMFTQIGARVPYYCTGGGKVILAFLPKETQLEYASTTRFAPFTKHTVHNKTELLHELETIRAQGFGYDREEREEGVLCIAAPVFDAVGKPVAAMSISGPAYRLEQKGIDEMTAAVCAHAKALSQRLGAAI